MRRCHIKAESSQCILAVDVSMSGSNVPTFHISVKGKNGGGSKSWANLPEEKVPKNHFFKIKK